MKKIKNIKLMLLGLLCLGSVNAFAGVGDYKGADGLRYQITSDTEGNRTAKFMGVSAELSDEECATVTIPATVMLPDDTGTEKEYTVTNLNNGWGAGNGLSTSRNVKALVKTLIINTRLTNFTFINNTLMGGDCLTALESLTVNDLHLMATIPAITGPATLKEIDFSGVSNDGQQITFTAASALTNLEAITLPGTDPVKIADNAFKGLANLKTVTFGAGKLTIGANAFENCQGTNESGDATAVTFVNLDKAVSIGAAAFKNCNMTTATIGADVATLGAGAFEGTTLQTIEFKSNKLAAIETGLFTNQAAVETLKVESTSVTEIKKGAFSPCTGLKNIDFSKATALTTIDATEFATLTTLVNVNFEGAPLNNIAGIVPTNSANSLETFKFPIGFNKVIPSFKNCAKVSTITIPAGATGITSFQFCKGLSSIDLSVAPGITSIPDDAFNMMVIADGTTLNTKDDKGKAIATASGIARFNTKLADVKLPATITSIGAFAFAGCSSLAIINLDALTSLKSLGASAFQYTVIPEVKLSGATNAGFTAIPNYAFADNTALTTVELPAQIKTIGDYAFSFGTIATNATNKKTESYGKGKLENVNLATLTAITSIGEFAFMGSAFNALDLSALTEITTIEEGTFAFNTKLATVVLPVQIDEIVGQYNGNAYYNSDDDEWYGIGAFADDTALAEINLNQTNITELDNIFTTYDGNSWLDYPKFTNERTIALGKDEKKPLILVKDETKTLANGDPLRDLKTIDPYALQFTSLKTITIPETVENMSVGAFRACVDLTTFEWRNAIQNSLPNDCFRGDVKLTDVTFLSIETCTTMSDADIFFMCNKDKCIVTVTTDSYNALVANGFGNDNRTYSQIKSDNNVQWQFDQDDKGLASDGYHYATYYNPNNSSWFDATKFDVFAAVVEANKVVLKPATADGGFYKVAKAIIDPYTDECENEKISLCVVRSKDKTAVPQLNSNDGNDQVSTLPVTNHLQMSDGYATGSKLNYVFKLGRNKSGVVAFYRIVSGTFPAGQIYINAEETSSRLNIIVEGEGEITGIENLFGAEKADNAPVYNLQGTRVNATNKGVYIKNGKKFIVK